VDELVIIDDTPQRKDGTISAGAAFLARVAQYLETPQYLRKALIPMHPDLRLAGVCGKGGEGGTAGRGQQEWGGVR
jgi:predicted SPOUT superfamily RNA methylase MTH1